MSVVGRVDSLWRFPVKSMRGEELAEAYLGYGGVLGDRICAFHDTAARKALPFLTARVQEQMLRFTPRFRHGARAAQPVNLADAEGLGPGVTPVYPSRDDLALDVETPSGATLAVDDPALIDALSDGLEDGHALSLLRSDRSLTDCRPVSLFSMQTVRQIGEEVGRPLDKRRFRANVYADFGAMAGFAEEELIGRRLRLGERAVIALVERDPRCKMITLDPDTAEANPEILRKVAHGHGGFAGLYGVVLTEGTVRRGDVIEVLG
ncbi:MAG: MOSC domain-containing protein [Alphaproteobacteria bacterium]|nr:MOSC domain-containing protein [Alphaproteobacteria bacterium]